MPKYEGWIDSLCGQNHDPSLRRLVRKSFDAGHEAASKGTLAKENAALRTEVNHLRAQLGMEVRRVERSRPKGGHGCHHAERISRAALRR